MAIEHLQKVCLHRALNLKASRGSEIAHMRSRLIEKIARSQRAESNVNYIANARNIIISHLLPFENSRRAL